MTGFVDAARYWLAVVLVVAMPPGLVFWFVVHPFVGFWRRVGVVKTYVVLAVVGAGMMVGLFLARDLLVATDYGTSRWTGGLGLVLLMGATVLFWKRKKHLDNKRLSGLHELDPSREDGRLLTEGIYGVIRHPRYVEVALAVLAYALMANYLGAYLIWVSTLLCLGLIVPLEERELEERFGEEYRRYREEVPAFIPRGGARSRG